MSSSNRSNLPKVRDLLFPILEILEDSSGGIDGTLLEARVAEKLRIPTALLQMRHSSGVDKRTEFQYRLAWARVYLKKVGLATNPRRNYWKLIKKPKKGMTAHEVMRIAMRAYD